MSRLGIGAAKVDLVLENDHYTPGEVVRGQFLIKGGTIEQKIKRIDCDLVLTDYSLDREGQDEVLCTRTILTTKEIESDGLEELSFTCELPNELKPSSKTIKYRFKTRLIFHQGIASLDHDEIYILT
jgi:sporulation-control protein